MKLLKNILTATVLVIMAAGLSSCYFRFSDKTKKLLKNELRYTLSDLDVKIDTVTYNVGQFNAVDIDMITDDIVIVQTEGESKVDLMACDFLIDSILVTNEEGTLKVRLNDGTSRLQGRIKVQVYAPALCSISNNGCGDISISAYKGDSLSIKTSGSGDVIATNLEIAGKLSVHSVGSGDHEFEHITAANMDIARSDRDFIYAISKKNCRVFKKFISRGDGTYNRGREKYEELAFQWWLLTPKNIA